MSQANSQFDKLVVLVHGVGDPQPGDSLGNFARSIALDDRPLDEHNEVLWLREKSDDSAHVQTFPVHVRDLQIENQQVQLAEVFWGDLSRVMQGVPGMIFGLFQILFGLRYVAYVAADQPGRFASWLKKLGLISSRILHGPVIAVTIFLAMLAASVSGTQMLWKDSYRGLLWTQMVIGGCSIFGLAACAVGMRLTRNRVIERFWFWFGVTSLFMLGLLCVKACWLDSAAPGTLCDCSWRPGLIWYCRVLVVFLGFLWFCEILVMLAMAACWLGAWLHPRANRRALNLAVLLPALAIGIWGQAIPMLWMSARTSIEKLLKLTEFGKIFEEAIPLLGVQFVMCVIMTAALGIIAARYLMWRSNHSVSDFCNGSRPPRLIVHSGLQMTLAGCAIAGVGLVLTISLIEAMGHSPQEFWLGRAMSESNKYAMATLVPLAFLIAFALPRLQPVFDIVLDVVNHFHFRATNVQDALDDDDEFDINETTFESGNLFFSRRQAVQSRMQRILTHYRDVSNHRPELVIVAHSQGTQIAIEVLNDPEMDWLGNQFRSVTLVTMGSPFTNLYQHYFAHLYPALDRPFWASLRTRVDRWVNIFRIDDPVGTEIDFAALQRSQNARSINSIHGNTESVQTLGFDAQTESLVASNHPVGCRGHVNYWTDREVLAIIRKNVFEPQENRSTAKPSTRAA